MGWQPVSTLEKKYGPRTTVNTAANPKAKISQAWLLMSMFDRLQYLYTSGKYNLIPPMIKTIAIFSRNIYDTKFKERVTLAKQKILLEAQKIFKLRPSDIKLKTEKYRAQQNFIKWKYHEKVLEELMLLYERRAVLPSKTFTDVETDLDLYQRLKPDYDDDFSEQLIKDIG